MVHRLEGHHLPVFGKGGLDGGERCACFDRHDHFGRVVGDDARHCAGGKRFICLDRIAETGAGVAADDFQRGFSGCVVADDVGDLGFCIGGQHGVRSEQEIPSSALPDTEG